MQLNADLGEGGKFDAEIIPLIDIANIACGAHAGDDESIANSIELAVAHNCVVSAHPGYPDRENFGRQAMQLSANELQNSLLAQLEKIAVELGRYNRRLAWVKPHGALYNECAIDSELADRFLNIIQTYDRKMGIIALAGSVLFKRATARGIACYAEGFADRRYMASGMLAPRHLAGACIDNVEAAVQQAQQLAGGLPVNALDSGHVQTAVHTICVHGDTPLSLGIAKGLYQIFKQVRPDAGT
ncbi:MAG: 5-oxoprolinase subunit PxpA [Gammaproteobacteria bacterium]|nr:5-oxoprolinase subunit PxpA [Gammaproteobacteria bacterium]NND39392.1 5-oxoprolinase subunit PxpA [Pseudomonadales bacterium]MBT8150437.1 5-oxoprolinase subunit PxpA [Gammaproteobacteria bacterium]NNL10992.1 5-oxoprolinase subunit PxpA [Pseudomonadales bacterium]NNM10617.1 5-oxoprolinase subunit PxpA [Pseudomonadales bacterium]